MQNLIAYVKYMMVGLLYEVEIMRWDRLKFLYSSSYRVSLAKKLKFCELAKFWGLKIKAKMEQCLRFCFRSYMASI